jgi:fatty-acyl-CoA synthase
MAAGERVVLLSENRGEFVEIYFAAAAAGVVVIPVNPRLAADEVNEIVADAEPRCAIVGESVVRASAGLRETGGEVKILNLGGEYESLIAAASSRPPDHVSLPDDVFLQIYTSGSTGAPKGVLLTQRNLSSNSWHLLAERALVPEDRFLNTAPLCHLAAGSRVFLSVLAAATNVVHETFDVERVAKAMRDGDITATVLVPTMLRSLLESRLWEQRSSKSRMRQITYGAAPIALETLLESMTRMGCDFQQGYGLTEAGNNLTILSAEDHRGAVAGTCPDRLSSIGRETTGVHVRVVDADDNDVALDEVGEIVACGSNIMKGYWRRPAETRDALRGGWLRTGDLATVDEDGYLYLVARKKDMLISGGFNVYPREVERLLEVNVGVTEVVVVGLPHDHWGEVPVAVVVAAPGVDKRRLELELRETCESSLARYKQPASYVFVETLPRTATGKIAKALLRNQLARDEAR